MIYRIILIFIITFSYTWLALAFEASYYSDAFEGSTSSNGSMFSQAQHTAAICYEELSQLAYISTTQTGMVVTLTDRPNCSRHSDRIDLSSSVFSTFAPLSKWLIRDISAVPLGIKTGKFIKRDLSRKEFSHISVELTRPIANTYIAGESVSIVGKVTSWEKYVMSYIENRQTWAQRTQSYRTLTDGTFDIVITFPDEPGEYYMVIAWGTSFETESPARILLVSWEALMPGGTLPISPRTSSLRLSPKYNGSSTAIRLPENTWGSLTLKGASTTRVYGKVLTFDTTKLSRGVVNYSFTWYNLSTPSSLDRAPSPRYVSRGTVLLDRIHETIGADRVRLTLQSRRTLFRFQVPTGKRVQSEYYVTLPNGDVRTSSFPSQYIDSSGYLRTGISIQSEFPMETEGTYMLETLEHDGFAYFNLPATRGKVWNIVTQLTDAQIRNIKKPETNVRADTYRAINTLRNSLGRSLIERDITLDTIAQKKSDNMANNNYVGHVTPDGKNIREFALSQGIKISKSLGENVAWGNVSGLALQDWLEESGSHRANMIDPDWTKVGIGYRVQWDQTYMVHIFSN